MQEESKEEYLARHRRSLASTEEEEEPEPEISLTNRIKSWFYLALLLVFVWIIYQMFGMMKSN